MKKYRGPVETRASGRVRCHLPFRPVLRGRLYRLFEARGFSFNGGGGKSCFYGTTADDEFPGGECIPGVERKAGYRVSKGSEERIRTHGVSSPL